MLWTFKSCCEYPSSIILQSVCSLLASAIEIPFRPSKEIKIWTSGSSESNNKICWNRFVYGNVEAMVHKTPLWRLQFNYCASTTNSRRRRCDLGLVWHCCCGLTADEITQHGSLNWGTLSIWVAYFKTSVHDCLPVRTCIRRRDKPNVCLWMPNNTQLRR